ncbi:MAG TPA: DCC1-like thiol-disulfide oxidoreductase family protein [Pyrinomonadaceae bacterium]|nr:DCC1-like thiol-disulfide oxidoreductase family protein [Pyrinomonadaceae bacterium]
MKLKYQIALAFVAVALIVVPLLLRRRAPAFVREFFNTPTHPVNLAVFRVILLTLTVFFFFTLDVTWYSRMPPELLFPPSGLGWVSQHLPINEPLARAVSALFLACCVAGVVGLFTRTSLVLGVISGVYVLGLPQLYGKINHYHHLLWFMAILAASPCADVLSLDALRAARRRADSGATEPPGPSLAYSLPLRFVWLMMGAIYFSAGIWKAWTGGYRWAFSDNLRNIMYNKWIELGDWTPLFRLDQYPLLYKLSAAGSILFELSFIVLIFFPLLRKLAAAAGVGFHAMIYMAMRINFYTLAVCYTSFFDWDSLFRSAGARLFREKLSLAYDGSCQTCRRTVAALRTLDVLGRINYVDLSDPATLDAPELRRLTDEPAAHGLYVLRGGGELRAGLDAYRAVAARIPVLWPLLPLLYVLPSSLVAGRARRHAADRRAREVTADKHSGAFGAAYYGRHVRAVAFVGALLLYTYSLASVVKYNSWPMALYPTFEDIDEPQVSVITARAEFPSGQVVEINPFAETSGMAPERLMALLGKVIGVEDAQERRVRLNALWKLWARDNPALRDAVSVRFYKVVLSSLPERRHGPPISQELLAELRQDSPDSAAAGSRRVEP